MDLSHHAMSPTFTILSLKEPSSLESKEELDRIARTVTLGGVSQCYFPNIMPKAGRHIPGRAL